MCVCVCVFAPHSPFFRFQGFSSPDFVINGNCIPAGSTAIFVYRVSVITTLSSGEEQSLSASASFSLSVNLPPSSGSCEVGPPEGFGLDTDFFISCHGWKDDSNSAISYEFIATTDSGEMMTLQPTTTSSYELRAFRMPSPKVEILLLPHVLWCVGLFKHRSPTPPQKTKMHLPSFFPICCDGTFKLSVLLNSCA